MKLCKKCHWKNNDEALFCAHCGKLMKSQDEIRKIMRKNGCSPEMIEKAINEAKNR